MDHKRMNLTLDDGTEVSCNVIDIIDVDSKSYIALFTDNQDQVFLYEYVDKGNDDFELLGITDKNIFDKVEDTFFNMLEEDEEE